MALSAGLISLPLPTQRIATELGAEEYLVDFHVHTTLSDGFLSPEARVRWYLSQGLHAAAFSDHHHTRGAAKAEAYVKERGLAFLVVPALEYTSDNPFLHLNVVGADDVLVPEGYPDDRGVRRRASPRQVIEDGRAAGGFVVVNHYHHREGVPTPSLEEVFAWGAEAFEVTNGDMLRYDVRLDEARTFCQERGLIALGVTDEHENKEISRFMRVRLEPGAALTVDNLLAALRRRDHEVLAIERHPDPLRIPERFSDLAPFASFLTYLRDLNRAQQLSWLVWSLLLYGFGRWVLVSIGPRRIG